MNRHLKYIFVLLVAALLATAGLIAHRELNPEWKSYQRAYFQEEAARVRQALAGADADQRENLRKRLGYLSRPDFRIRQILLDNGRRADRCVTCHLDLERLEKAHPQIKQFPFEQYGCTVCHGGVGRATGKAQAHSTLRIPHRPLHEYLQAHASKTSPIDLFNYGADGRPIGYSGSQLCLRCHQGSHPRHVARWRKLKFQPLGKVRKKLQELRAEGVDLTLAQCLTCHTTGYNAEDGSYAEDRVTCENCHGPGAFYVDLMAGGKAREGAELARVNILETQAQRICLNCHKPERHDSYLGQDSGPAVLAAPLDGAPPPVLDGLTGDSAWRTAAETRVPTWRLGDGAPRPGTEVRVRAVFDHQRIYFVFRWFDPQPQNQMGHWLYGPSGWQAQAAWPDALALDWQATAKVADFKQGGCAVLCHTTGRFAAFPRMATGQDGAVVDEWYWNAFSAEKAGRPGDGFLDNRVEFIAPGSPLPPLRWARTGQSAAHGDDTSAARLPAELGGVPLILNMQLHGNRTPGPAFRLQQGRRVPLQPGESAIPGQMVPLYVGGPPAKGDSADIAGRAAWADGYWTLELGRALRTDSPRDIQFQTLPGTVTFGLAVWDGSIGEGHQVATLVTLRFTTPLKTNPQPSGVPK